MSLDEYEGLQRGDIVYFARTMPAFGYYEIHDVSIVTKNDKYCTVCEGKTKQTFLFNSMKAVCEQLYINRNEALEYLEIQEENNKDRKVYSKVKEDQETE